MIRRLPTEDQIQACMDSLNAGRAVYGAAELTTLEFDESEPSNGVNCLSARHLAVLGGGRVGCTHFHGITNADALAKALGTCVEHDPVMDIPGSVRIPSSILAVTDVFDSVEAGSSGWDDLREVLELAGVVD